MKLEVFCHLAQFTDTFMASPGRNFYFIHVNLAYQPGVLRLGILKHRGQITIVCYKIGLTYHAITGLKLKNSGFILIFG